MYLRRNSLGIGNFCKLKNEQYEIHMLYSASKTSQKTEDWAVSRVFGTSATWYR